MSDDLSRLRLRGRLRAWFTSLREERNLSPHTVESYKDSWRLLVDFGIERRGMSKSGDWCVIQVDRTFVLDFLMHLEVERSCTVATRNVRLAALQSFFRWLKANDPVMGGHCTRILGIPSKRCTKPLVDHLERDELRAVFAAVPNEGALARRDLALLCLAYNTGGRVQELADVRSDALRLRAPATVRLWGKGRKQRELPLWPATVTRLQAYLRHRRVAANDLAAQYVFLNHRGERMTRWGIAAILEQAMARAEVTCPSLVGKRLSAHSMRHTTAVHLLQSGVDLVTIQNWLGHRSPETVHTYLALDLKSRRDLLERCLDLGELLQDRGTDPDWLTDL